MYLIDTNIFLEVLLGQDKQDECILFLKLVEQDSIKAAATTFTVHSIEVIMNNYHKTDELRIFLESITELKGLKIYNTTISEEINAIEEMEAGLDFDDALQVSAARTLNVDIVSYDRHFDKVKDLNRKTPKEVLQ